LAQVALGKDPASDRRARRDKDAHTLKATAAEYLAAKQSDWAERTAVETERYLTDSRYFGPLHSLPSRPRLNELVPWFIIGFLIVLAIRSAGFIPQSVLPAITGFAAFLTTIAMAALGLGVDVRAVARTGARVTLAVIASLIVLGLMSYGLIRLMGLP
jgi:hypothetical protein